MSSARGDSPLRSSKTVWIRPGAMIAARKPTATKMCTRCFVCTDENLIKSELEVQKRIERLREHREQRGAKQRMHDDGLRPRDLPAPFVRLHRPGDDHGPDRHHEE